MTFRSAEEIVQDTYKGSSELAIEASESIIKLKDEEIEKYLITLVKKRPTMTPIINLVNKLFLAEEKGHNVKFAAKNFINKLIENKNNTVKQLRNIFLEKVQNLACQVLFKLKS